MGRGTNNLKLVQKSENERQNFLIDFFWEEGSGIETDPTDFKFQ